MPSTDSPLEAEALTHFTHRSLLFCLVMYLLLTFGCVYVWLQLSATLQGLWNSLQLKEL